MPSEASLLGKEIPAAPISPMTLPLNPGGAPSLSLGGAGQSAAAAPMPAGRQIANLRTPRGANFIRLAFAAVFLLGFLGLVGFLVKDYLPDIFPSLVAREEAEPGDTAEARLPTTAAGASADHPPLTSTTTAENPAAPASYAETGRTPPLMIGGFDPAEPTPLKAQPVTPAETATLDSASSANPPITLAPPVETTPTMSASSGTLLEVPAGAAENVASSASMTNPPASRMQASVSSAEDDAPPEAKPAVEALKKFLAANSLAERLKYTLGADMMQPLMERYYTRSSAGPVVVDRIQFVRMDPNPELGSGRHCILSLENQTWEYPVPVMLEEQSDGFKVDWLAFVEFKDRLLEKFFQAYQEGPARFHVGIIRHHYFEDGVPNLDRKDAFRVSPAPPNSFQASAFLDKDTPLAQELRVRLPWETHVWAVVELEWKKLGSQQWVELSAVPQLHWYSLPAGPRPISTPQKAREGESMPPGISKNGVGSKSGSSTPPPGIRKSDPSLPGTIKRPLPAGR